MVDNNAAKADLSNTPIAFAEPIGLQMEARALCDLVVPFASASIAERFLGPAWVSDTGIACIVFVTGNARWIGRLERADRCAALAWRWNHGPSTYLSLTLMASKRVDGEPVRWMAPSEGPAVQAIRREAKFRFCVALSGGRHTQWFEATFRAGGHDGPVDRKPLEDQWTFPTPGIPYSNTTERFDPLRDTANVKNRHDEIPLWAEAVVDFWDTMSYEGPWGPDLSHQDRVRAQWGREAARARQRAAGFIQVIIDQQKIDGKPPIFDADGRLAAPGNEKASEALLEHPKIAHLLVQLAGPAPNPQQAQRAALAVLHDPASAFAILSSIWKVIHAIDDDDLNMALHALIKSALLDASSTKQGRGRPWLTNIGDFKMELRINDIDMTAPISDVHNLWRQGLDIMDVIDIGLRVGPSDFPAPFDKTCERLAALTLEGSLKDADHRINELLMEAQEARQWSIPWGARVQVSLGLFTSVRIFEKDSEFSCHFLDDQDRYFHVAIGLAGASPRAAAPDLLRIDPQGGEPEWNLEAQAAVKLIAAAIVRDFLVVEDREAVFTGHTNKGRRRAKSVPTVIYLPRVRYDRPLGVTAPSEEAVARAQHSVAAHLRRVGEASPAARLMAQKYGFHIPQGFTFVRPHERGSLPEADRLRIYRSRSASRMIFEAVGTAPEGTRPAWFDFEKDCARLMKARGLEVIHQAANRDADGGVDLYACDEYRASWVIQCKCWAPHRTVGPDIVRELQGALHLADQGSTSTSCGIIITTSSFSEGAKQAGARLGFELIDGAEFSRLIGLH